MAEPAMPILDTLWQLIGNLGTLASELVALGWRHVLIILWVVWWLWGVRWNRAWTLLGQGAWAPLVLMMFVSALVWSRIAPSHCGCLGFMDVPNFLWQLGYVSLLVAIMFFCGWLQGVFQWAPEDVNLAPPTHGHGHGHGHDHHDSHGSAHGSGPSHAPGHGDHHGGNHH